MSFNLFLYYCAVFGAYAALSAAFISRLVTQGVTSELLQSVIDGALVGALISFAVGVLDTVWSTGKSDIKRLVIRSLGAGFVGLFGGILGGVTGSVIVRITGVQFFVLIGWTISGLLIGLSLGLFDLVFALATKSPAPHDNKIKNGLMGGALGGFLGGAFFLFFKLSLGAIFGRENLLSASGLGFVALGAAVGFFIGLAQVVLKEAWVRVEAGKRVGKELILSKPETFFGRAETCDIGLFGDNSIEKIHAKLLMQKNRYLIADAGSASGTFLNDQKVTKPTELKAGDLIRLGSYLLRFNEKPGKKK
jgi:MFS family permease